MSVPFKTPCKKNRDVCGEVLSAKTKWLVEHVVRKSSMWRREWCHQIEVEYESSPWLDLWVLGSYLCLRKLGAAPTPLLFVFCLVFVWCLQLSKIQNISFGEPHLYYVTEIWLLFYSRLVIIFEISYRPHQLAAIADNRKIWSTGSHKIDQLTTIRSDQQAAIRSDQLKAVRSDQQAAIRSDQLATVRSDQQQP